MQYFVNATSGSSYKWIIKGGTQASGGNSASITVDWNSTVGWDTIKVIETNQYGCSGDTIALPVYRMPLPTATISSDDTICYNFSTVLTVKLTGMAPWTISYTDGTTTKTVTGITTSPYTFATPKLTATTTYSLVSVTNAKSCAGTVSGSAKITVNPKPTTVTKIFHK